MATSFASATGAPEVGNVATPINSSAVARTYINNLPAYRAGLSPFSRGLEVGIAHGYWFYGPFALLGPLRNTDYSSVAGALCAVSFVFILTVAIAIYSATSPAGPAGTLTTPNPPESYATREGWSNFASGFFIGGCGGAVFAFLLTQSPHLLPLQSIFGGM
ncbi:photosystem I reaction center subunit XI [Leptothoe sp. PORK10 BA2]|uniref:photosystem I reaction center subunit XI n=1 Tax=Leptothoe sp. PORK10 BA2 TaxID=3110254 RepID=UPI002B2091B4|nr:photosystem I reaction center subunit XI [Leptothoe sp. PORK10 BA2]MEA5465112.1 photosystem I reaction center subunit XI [Leptothoe sp. PORK10 BA2]